MTDRESLFASRTDWAIIWPRPDGWWCAGDGWDTEQEATDAAMAHNWGSQAGTWRVVGTRDLPAFLCADAMESYLYPEDGDE